MSRSLPGLGLTGFWGNGVSGWDTGMDTNLRELSAVTQGRALDLVGALPGSPTDGDIYILDNTAGADAGKIAIRDSGAWVKITPQTGWRIYDVAAKMLRRYNGYTWIKADTVINVQDYGAKCDANATGSTGTDDTAAVQAAINAASALGGGTVFIPAHTKCASSLAINQKYNIRLVGPVGQGGTSQPPAAQLIYTGTGSRFIDARSSYGIVLENLGVRYTSGSFTGTLIDFSHDNATDAAYCLVQRCLVGGIGVWTATRLISLENAILCSVVDNHICNGVVGIGGRREVSVGNTGYSNAMLISRNTFGDCTTSALLNAGESWTVIGNWFEGTNGGSGGMPRCYWDDISAASAAITSGLVWIGNWCGDCVAVTDAAFCNNFTTIRGLTISGGNMGTNSTSIPAIKLSAACTGVSITGVNLTKIDLVSQSHAGVNIRGCFMASEIANHSNVIDFEAVTNYLDGGRAKSYRRLANMVEDGIGAWGGEAVTQASNRSTGVTTTKLSGVITLASGAGSATWATFHVTNTLVKNADTFTISQRVIGGSDTYETFATAGSGGFNIWFRTTGGTTTETVQFNFRVHSGSDV